jgi:hypothetical protein
MVQDSALAGVIGPARQRNRRETIHREIWALSVLAIFILISLA